MDFEKIIKELKQEDVGEILEFEPMYKHTTYKVGGPARGYIQVKDIPALKKIMKIIKRENCPYYVIGKGSNVLFSDKEFDGLILSLNEHFTTHKIEDNKLIVDAGVSVIKMATLASNHALSGLEFISGIPANVGGAVYMNAGAYKSEVADVLESVLVLNDQGEVETLTKDQCEFSYRKSFFQKHADFIILQATFTLQPGSKEEIKELMKKRRLRRQETQPIDKPSAGSVFRNPDEHPAWKYIDDCGLRGYTIGHACFSKKHSNFIVNKGYASAQDIKSLIEYAQDCVYEKYQVKLHTEVRFMNW